jgi:NADH-quinone oxidoreductase subunit L
MLLPVGVLAVLATVGGLVVIPGVWEPFLEWIDVVAEPLVKPSVAQDYATSAVAVALAGIGIWLAHRAFLASRELVPEGRVRTLLEHKFYFDELYDAVFARPAQLLADGLRTRLETPIVQGSIDELADGTRDVGGGVAGVQTGLLRTYALVVTASVVILAIVFLVLR